MSTNNSKAWWQSHIQLVLFDWTKTKQFFCCCCHLPSPISPRVSPLILAAPDATSRICSTLWTLVPSRRAWREYWLISTLKYEPDNKDASCHGCVTWSYVLLVFVLFFSSKVLCVDLRNKWFYCIFYTLPEHLLNIAHNLTKKIGVLIVLSVV